MMRFDQVWGMARAEMRLTRRLVRYWIFLFLSFVLAVAMFAYHGALHYFASTLAASFAMINPRVFAGSYGASFLLLYMLGTIFLGFDVRARDVRERMVEVLDARPVTNLELLTGRWLGLLIASWVPMLVLVLLLLAGGSLFGESPEPVSLLLIATLGAIPALAFALGLVTFVSIAVRKRLVAALILIAAWALLFALFSAWIPVPFWFSQGYDVAGAYTLNFPSDLTSSVPRPEAFAQRAGVLLLGLGLLLLGVLFHPRKDDQSPGSLGGAALALLVIGALGVSTPVALNRQSINRFRHYAAVHAGRAEETAPDLTKISGEVRLDPGRSLGLDLEIQLQAPPEEGLRTILLSFNPGFRVGTIEAGGSPLDFTFADGLLEISPPHPLAPGESLRFRLRAEGVPSEEFAYLDGGFSPLEIKTNEGITFLFGFQNLFFERRFVALPEGVRWLPAGGAEVGRGNPRVRPPDFFDLDLTVEAPASLALAGPGRAEEVEGAPSGRARWRFVTGPLPGAGLVAGPFVERSAEIDGVLFRALLSPQRARNLAVFDEAGGEIRKWLAEHLDDAEQLGLHYPYGGLTLVEVPNALRGFGGGWRRDTALAQPAMALVRESGLPTARFDAAFDDASDFSDKEGGLPRAVLERLEAFFRGDAAGGDPVTNGARSFLGYRIGARGRGSIAADYLTEVLASRLLTGEQSYFSTRMFEGGRANRVIGQAVGSFVQNQDEGFSAAVARLMTDRSTVWEAATKVSLADLDPEEDPQRAIDVLALKGGAMARSLIDGVGREKTGRFLALLAERFDGGSYDLEQLLDLAEEIDPGLRSWLNVGLRSEELAAFRAERAEVFRLEDEEDGTPRYQMLLHVWNEADAPGLLRVKVKTEEGKESRATAPIRFDAGQALEIGTVSTTPPTAVTIEPYLSLNRHPFDVPLGEVDAGEVVAREPFAASRVWNQPPPATPGILIDDLDPSVSFEAPVKRGWFRRGGRASDEDLDQGLPVHGLGRGIPSYWVREQMSGAEGRYRHTVAVVRPKAGVQQVVATTEIPAEGRWVLEMHYPGPGTHGKVRGSWKLSVSGEGTERELSWPLAFFDPGWYEVETFDLPRGEVTLRGSAEENTNVLFLDAVRWRPLSHEVAEEE